MPFAVGYVVLAVLWLLFTVFLILVSGQSHPWILIDYRVLITMIGAGFGALYTPVHILAKFRFN